MTPKEKVEELYNKYEQLGKDFTRGVSMAEFAKQCALIAVDEIFEFMKMDDEYTETVSNANSKWVDYWLEVKKEIEKL